LGSVFLLYKIVITFTIIIITTADAIVTLPRNYAS
jgi:hypothetical protein